MRKNKVSVVVLLVLVFILTDIVFAKDRIIKNTITFEGNKRSYYLFVPESIKKGDSVPLIALLHGSGHNGRILIEHWQKLAEQEKIILVGPDAGDSDSWNIPEDGPQFLYNVVEEVKSNYSVDSRRIYLFGHSAGANFGLLISVLESRYFAATALSAGVLKEDAYYLLDSSDRKIPVAFFIGTKDPFFPLPDVRKTYRAFVERKFPAEITEIQNHNHDYYSRSKEINENAWNFLKKQKLADNPEYKQYQFKSN